MDYFGARYYDSRLGFWMSVDPLADQLVHQSPYLYCSGNPVSRVDPDGNLDLEMVGKGLMTGLGGVGVAVGGFALASGAVAATGATMGGTTPVTGPAAAGGMALMVEGFCHAGIGLTMVGIGLLTDPCEANTTIKNEMPTSATNALAKSADIIAGNEHHQVENVVSVAMAVATAKPTQDVSTAIQGVQVVSTIHSLGSAVTNIANEFSPTLIQTEEGNPMILPNDNTRVNGSNQQQPIPL